MYDDLFRLLEQSLSDSSPDWSVWLDRFILTIVKLNPSRAIQTVVAENPETASDLFAVSFHALWNDPNTPISLTRKISETFSSLSSSAPPPVVELILNIVEYTLVNGGSPIPIATPVLARAAETCLIYPKAIFFREQELRETSGLPSSECVESLIGLNIKLDIKDSAHALLRSSTAEYIKVRPDWHERLGNWSAALSAYSVKQLSEPEGCTESMQGRLRCLSALGEWERILDLSKQTGSDPRSVQLTGNACVNLQRWDHLADLLQTDSSQGKTFDDLILHIANKLRQRKDVTSLMNEAYAMIGGKRPSTVDPPSNMRLYSDFLKAEQLELLQDFTVFSANKIGFIEKWKRRLLQLDYSLEVWNRLVPLRALLLDPFTEDLDIWVKYSTLARKKQNLIMSDRIVERLASHPASAHLPGVILSQIKNTYVRGDTEKAIFDLEQFLSHQTDHPRLLAKCYHALALWVSDPPAKVEEFLRRSISLQPDNYKAWSSYALEKFKQTREMGFGIAHVSETIRALARCIELNPTQIQDVLRYLSLWFSYYGKDDEIDFQFDNVMEAVPVSVWVPALPQILARLRSRRSKLRDAVRSLVVRIGLNSPQDAVFPLAVLSQSENTLLAEQASNILETIRSSFPELVKECELVSSELVRVTATWHDRWASWLEEASRLFFVDNKRMEMLKVLETAYESTVSPSTPSEESFVREFGHALAEAKHFLSLDRIDDTHNINLMEAWRIFYEIFQKLHEMNATTTSVDLHTVSPKLFAMQNCSIHVPRVAAHVVDPPRIHSFSCSIEILPSKQKPRVINIIGTDGYSYKYLLKGNEDLKQDERVMQLFKLVNSVVAEAVVTRRRSGVFPSTPGIETLENVQLRRYAVIPLSNNTGLIEWVPSCDTLHSLIKQYRETVAAPTIPVAVEHNIMRGKFPRYEEVPLINKLCIFEHALLQTEGMELHKMMFRNAGNCDKWLKSRLMYSRSLAVTSIVGYVLGLGDRHPSNLLIDRDTGQVVHVDFGDCFDVTVFRDRYPEKIPFRLTRQLVNALEVAGLEGTFRTSCERVMDLIRKNRDTIMAMLEAFIYDPLVTWRLLPGGGEETGNLSWQARAIVDRVNAKILDGGSPIPVQIDRLIREATAHENLCSLYLGYCAFW